MPFLPFPQGWKDFLDRSRNLQPLTTPDSGVPRTGLRPWGRDSLHPVVTDMPACPSEQRRDPAVAVAAILAGQRYDGQGELIFVVSLCRPVALRAAWLLHHPARMPFTQPMRVTRMVHRTASSFRA
jgi:hypothetical protein